MDRRFGENDATLTPEERMLERFARERQRSSKGINFNLEDDDEELTHYGTSLAAIDDFEAGGLTLENDGDDQSREFLFPSASQCPSYDVDFPQSPVQLTRRRLSTRTSETPTTEMRYVSQRSLFPSRVMTVSLASKKEVEIRSHVRSHIKK